MNNIKRKWDRLSEEQRKQVIDKLIGWYELQRNEKIGYLAAEEILDFILELTSDLIYQKGVKDCRQILEQKIEDLIIDIELLG